jgi:hypothetical protein
VLLVPAHGRAQTGEPEPATDLDLDLDSAEPLDSEGTSAADDPAAGPDADSSDEAGSMAAGSVDPPPAANSPEAASPESADAAARALSDAQAAEEAAAIEAQMTEEMLEDAAQEGYSLNLYGFIDLTYSRAIKEFAFGSPYDSFAVGHLNLYAASELGDNWRTLAEVRVTYLPHGAYPPDPTNPDPERVNTTTTDYTDVDRPVELGGLMIERAWLEYTAHSLASIRAGQWLTPYGIWNVDHGSPVIVGVRRPFIVGERFLPERQTGIQLHGSTLLGRTKLGYNLTLSNGRGAIDAYRDLDRNKAVGGRFFANFDTNFGTLSTGMSGYRGRYTDSDQEFGVTPEGEFTILRPVTARFDEFSLAADAKWEWDGFLMQTEAIMNEVAYEDAVRPVALTFPGAPPARIADHRRRGVYGLTGYRFEWLGIMPWAGIEAYDTGVPGVFSSSAAFWGGINLRPTPRVVLKTQYTYSWFLGEDSSDEHFNNLDIQAAWSF